MQATPNVYPPGSVRMRPMLDALARNWWLIVLRGVLAVVFGVLAFIWPGITLITLIFLYGAFAFADGVLAIAAAIRGGSPVPRWWLVLVGVFGILAGVLTAVWPQITALVLLLFIAGWAIATGVLQIIGAIKLRHEIDDEWLLIASGVLSVAFGVLLAAWPGAGALAMVLVIGAFAIMYGALLILFGLRLRKHAEVRL
ncbi:HdeD family acid-resistance protein [uncultured Hyphomicrobium sp.]|uniref:HdeD family acid-resistance protein n=1 Tax=uncultured Hyphomicrobium sp. TaxID=194373 RepID=UPI0025ED0981|nr:HdeD family acid-resistance protein [uncultured Hyphomicrobium sp.]